MCMISHNLIYKQEKTAWKIMQLIVKDRARVVKPSPATLVANFKTSSIHLTKYVYFPWIYRIRLQESTAAQFNVSYGYNFSLFILFINWVRYINNAKPFNVSTVVTACHDVMWQISDRSLDNWLMVTAGPTSWVWASRGWGYPSNCQYLRGGQGGSPKPRELRRVFEVMLP